MTDAIHAVLAVPPGVNVGMAASERGLAAVAAAANVRVVPRRHAGLLRRQEALPDAADVHRRMDSGLAATVALETLPRRDEGRLLYWGDFHHMLQYVQAVARIDQGNWDRALRLLLAAGATPDVLADAQTFGGTLLFNSAEDLGRGDYVTNVSALIAGCAGSWWRDPISVTLARRLTARENVWLGVDPALLAPVSDPSSDDEFIGVFLGRTSAAHGPLLALADGLSRHLAVPCRWLDWGCERAFPALAADSVRAQLGARTGRAPTSEEVLSQLARARAVVTDSYHLSLIAWAWGIAAVTISGVSDPEVPASVDGGRVWSWRDKRELMASQYGALDFLVRPEEWTDSGRVAERLDHVCAQLEQARPEQIRATIAADTARTRAELLESWRVPVEPVPTRDVPVHVGASRVRVGSDTVRAAAVVVVRNERIHIQGLIRNLILDGLDVVVIDHGSTDGTGELAGRWHGRGVLAVERRGYDGVFRLRDQLAWKQAVYDRLDHDWVLHVDADEWPQARRPGDRLVDAMTRADAAGMTVIDFDEFVFLPAEHLPAEADPREAMLSYYHYAPSLPRLMRAWRRDAGLTSAHSGGHVLTGDQVRVHRERGILRHYPVLGEAHGAAKYLTRRFAADELAAGWHANRVHLRQEAFIPRPSPAVRRLARWDSRAFDETAPSRWHFWESAWADARPAASRLSADLTTGHGQVAVMP